MTVEQRRLAAIVSADVAGLAAKRRALQHERAGVEPSGILNADAAGPPLLHGGR